MIKLLIGGSPCTHWSIAQSKNRETKAEGLGWELFLNFVIAKEKFKPDFFLYENNWSASKEIKDQIQKELDCELMRINSKLVSAQNRDRFYVFNWDVKQPEDRGILLRDILETNSHDFVDNYNQGIEPLRVLEATKQGYVDIMPGECVDLAMENSKTRRGRRMEDKSNCLTTSNAMYEYCGTVDKPIYKFCNDVIVVNGKEYPVRLREDYYITRKLSVAECCRLQTMPDDYCDIVSTARGYRCLGNGWTAEVIIHILQGALKDVPRDEKIVVLSMYDGIATGRYCLDKMGFTNVEYHAYEIDKYAIKVAMSNYPDIIQHGDAFQIRNENWIISL